MEHLLLARKVKLRYSCMISLIRNKPGGLRLWVCVRVIGRHLTWHTGGVQGQDVILRASSDIWVPTKLNTEPRNHQSLTGSLYAFIITDNNNAPIWGLKMRYSVLTACPRLLWHFNKLLKLCVRRKKVIWCNQALQLVQGGSWCLRLQIRGHSAMQLLLCCPQTVQVFWTLWRFASV